MVSCHIDEEFHVIEVTVSGSIGKNELLKALSELESPLADWQEIRILKRIDSFSGIAPMALLEDFKFAFNNISNLKKIKKVAVVTDQEWIGKLSELSRSIFSGEVEVFDTDEIEKARSWLR